MTQLKSGTKPQHGAPPKFPLPLRVFNGVGGALRAAGLPLIRLDAESLLQKAERATGLNDFGDDAFRVPLGLLIDSLEREAQLTMLGRVIARTDAVRLLANRLRLVDAWKRHPEILAGEVRAPLFIVGLPRTGTSILHELMAQDPANRVPMTWEVHQVWPPPERSTYETDPRIDEVDQHLNGVDRLIPDFKQMHPMAARLPQECAALTGHDFATMIHHTTHNVLAYETWFEGADLRWVYASHRRQLQYLQWRCPGERWVLKSPQHLWTLDSLLAIYPDARIIQTHRDPLKVIASLTSLVSLLRSMASDQIDPLAIGADWTRRLAAGLQKAIDVRAHTNLPPERVFDVQFKDFVGNEVAMIRRIYEHFGMTLEPVAEERMRRFLADNPADKHGRHRYTLAAAGLDPEVERRRYASYYERFGVTREEAS